MQDEQDVQNNVKSTNHTQYCLQVAGEIDGRVLEMDIN